MDGGLVDSTARSGRSLLSLVVSQKLGMLTSSENSADLVVLRELIESGKVTPVIDKTYPLGEVPVAIRYLIDGHAARQGRHRRLSDNPAR